MATFRLAERSPADAAPLIARRATRPGIATTRSDTAPDPA
jgi:hypothetical protein